MNDENKTPTEMNQIYKNRCSAWLKEKKHKTNKSRKQSYSPDVSTK